MGRCSKLRVALDTFYCVIRELVLYNCSPIRVEHKKMASEHTSSDFESSVAFDHQRIKAAAVYCSDGRFGEQFDDFLHNSLGLPRYDRVAIPGGPACLAEHFATYRQGDAVVVQLEFLINVHQVKRVILIAHEACAFYTQLLQISPLGLKQQQLEDIAKAANRVQQFASNLVVETYFAHMQNNHVIFERIV